MREPVEIDFPGFVMHRESERAALGEFAVGNFPDADGIEVRWEEIEHIGIEPHAEGDDARAHRQERERDGVDASGAAGEKTGDGTGHGRGAGGAERTEIQLSS